MAVDTTPSMRPRTGLVRLWLARKLDQSEASTGRLSTNHSSPGGEGGAQQLEGELEDAQGADEEVEAAQDRDHQQHRLQLPVKLHHCCCSSKRFV